MNALFPEEGLIPYWYDRAKAAFTGIGAKDPLGLNVPSLQTVSVPRGGFVPIERALGREMVERHMDIANFAGGIRAFHGSPHRFTRFDSSKIGTGEGAQAFGHGHYLAELESVGRGYREKLAGRIHPNERKIAEDFLRESGGNFDKAYSAAKREIGTESDVIVKLLKQSRADKKLADNLGYMYEVDINTTPNRLLDWDKPFSGQSPYVQGRVGDFIEQRVKSVNAARAKAREEINKKIARGEELTLREKAQLIDSQMDNFTGKGIYQFAEGNLLDARYPGEKGPEVAEFFRTRGVPGIQYLDAGSRAVGEGSRNYVIFDDNLLDILRRYGTLGPVSAGVVNSLLGGQDDPRQ